MATKPNGKSKHITDGQYAMAMPQRAICRRRASGWIDWFILSVVGDVLARGTERTRTGAQAMARQAREGLVQKARSQPELRKATRAECQPGCVPAGSGMDWRPKL